ncbi:permease [Clostridium formicaceticum]|uniref:Permease n=1 Tax=Clostridium formicaceticum TaxID=1497 RepID=A0AAC9WJC1_9CLOT|nr:permease [Clostridium formicaceticum]AOY74918.1 permease [Clostridium formicaceticum]ARE89325.1 putative permease [Clostridium formicaceticum]
MKKMIKVVRNNKLLSIVVLIYLSLLLFLPVKAIDSSRNSLYYIKEMFQIMPIVFILTALIEAWMPKDMIINSFGEKSGVKGAVFSLILGSFSAGPIYAAFPICKMLLKKGASIANVVIILSAWAVIKVPMLANEAKFLGSKFMLIRWVLTIISILIMAYIITVIVKKTEIPMVGNLKQKEKNKINVKGEYCIHCGLCEKMLPQYFTTIGNRIEFTQQSLPDEVLENINSIIEKCPAKAIGYHHG